MEWNGYQYEMWHEDAGERVVSQAQNKEWILEKDKRGNGEGWYFVFVGIPKSSIEGPFDSEGQASQVLQARIDEMKKM